MEPVVGQWYRRLDQDQTLRIVRLDEDGNRIEVELSDGRREQIEAGEWRNLALEEVATPPESRPEDLEPDDMDHRMPTGD